MGGCFPNCHPAGGVTPLQGSGNIALMLAVICLIALVVLRVRGK